jgi:predicted site-specific integrase-resolvase
MSGFPEPLLGQAKVARLLGIEVDTLGVWRRKGYGPRWYRIGKKIKYAAPDVRAWMNAQARPDNSASGITSVPGERGE